MMQHPLNSFRHDQKYYLMGFALQEIALALLLMLLVSIVAFSWFSSSQQDRKILEEMNILPKMVGNIRGLYSRVPGFQDGNQSAVQITSLISNGVFPKTFADLDSTEAYNQFGGKIEVVASGNNLKLRYPKIPTEVCTQIIPRVAHTFIDIAVNGDSVFLSPMRADPTLVGQACSKSTENELVLTIGK